MRKLNLKREKRKLWLRQHRSSIIKYGSVAICSVILTIAVMYFSQASFSTRVTFDVIDARVAPFSKGDVIFAYNVDGESVSTLDSNITYYYTSSTCTNGATYVANRDWQNGTIYNIAYNGTKCTLYLTTEISFPVPELYDALIPVYYDESGNVYKADYYNTNNSWYDYDEHKWANAVLVSDTVRDTYNSLTVGQQLTSTSEILQYYVWIPRYRYKLFSNAINKDSLIDGGNTPEQIIEIEFETSDTPKSTGQLNGLYTKGQWYTHPAFTFGENEINGFWVGKFEPAYNGSNKGQANGLGCTSSADSLFTCTNETCSNATNIRILPNVNPIRRENVSNYYYISRSIASSGGVGLSTTKTDSHMMKNMEWGAVAYLTSSIYGRYTSSSTCTS